MSALGDRLRARGVDPGSFLAWAQAAGYQSLLNPLDGYSDRGLDDIVAVYRIAIGSPPARPAASRMTPEQAHRLVEEGAARHRARMLAEQITREVIAERLRVPSLSETCPKCSVTKRCWEHER